MDAAYDELPTDDISFSFKVSGDFDKEQINKMISMAKGSWNAEAI